MEAGVSLGGGRFALPGRVGAAAFGALVASPPRLALLLLFFLTQVESTLAAAPIACCLPDGGCSELEHDGCVQAGGDPHPPGSVCPGTPCDPVVFAAPPVFSPSSPEPDCFHGFFQPSMYGSPRIAALDVTLAENSTITRIRWWGLYVGWIDVAAPPVAPTAFHIGLWSHGPAGSGSPPIPFPHPDVLLQSWVVPRAALDETWTGCALSTNLESQAGDAFSYSYELPEGSRPNLGAATAYWWSVSSLYVEPGCACVGDVAAPFGSPNSVDVAAINARIGCAIGAGDSVCDASDVNCDGAVTGRDAEIAQCQVLHAWANPDCCVPTVEFPWGVVTTPVTGQIGVVMSNPVAPESGQSMVSGDLLRDGFGDAWDVALSLHGAGSVIEAPPAPLPEASAVLKNRFISFSIPPAWEGREIALRVRLLTMDRFPAFNGETRWAGQFQTYLEAAGSPQSFRAAELTCAPTFQIYASNGVAHLYGPEVVPLSQYEIEAVDRDCENQLGDPACFSAALPVSTAKWGDVAAPFGGASQPNFADISAVVDKFRALAGSVSKTRAQLQPNSLDPAVGINFLDISSTTNAFRGSPYSLAGPDHCP